MPRKQYYEVLLFFLLNVGRGFKCQLTRAFSTVLRCTYSKKNEHLIEFNRIELLPVRLLFLPLQLPVSLLQLVREELQVPGQLVVSLKLLRHEYQVSGSVM